jgi:acetyl-CoA synthetase
MNNLPFASHSQLFHPPAQFSANAHIKNMATYEAFYQTAELQPDSFWTELSRALVFDKPFEKILDWKCPKANWFVGAKINVSKNCLDRHVKTQPHKTALIWESEPMEQSTAKEIRRLSYEDLLKLTCQIANTLVNLGVKKGDRVAIYMPMVPETVASMQACARIGAIHTVIFGGFSSQSIADRIGDCTPKLVITANGTYRKAKWMPLKPFVDEALQKSGTESVEKVLVWERDSSQKTEYKPDRDVKWSQSVDKAADFLPPVPLDSEDPLFILYTSGTTGKPKGLFHTQAGYLLWAHWSTRWLFDIKDNDIFWCTADCGWITGHTYLCYGPLSDGTTVMMYEGHPHAPNPGRFWDIIDRHHVTILYTSPTAVRSFMRTGDEWPKKFRKDSLRLLGTVGEPINPEAWLWYYKNIGNSKCPIVDTYWQTETGGALIAPFPGASILKPGSATQPLPGIITSIRKPQTGEECEPGEKGVLVLEKPWPSMARGIWGDPARFNKTYWNTSEHLINTYCTHDFAVKDKDGDYWIEGRMDDVLNVSGHRIGSAELESALIECPYVAESAAVGIPDSLKGQGIALYVSLKDSALGLLTKKELSHEIILQSINEHILKEIGAIAKPDRVEFLQNLPKTRSGKIMRRLVRELATHGKYLSDTTTLDE